MARNNRTHKTWSTESLENAVGEITTGAGWSHCGDDVSELPR